MAGIQDQVDAMVAIQAQLNEVREQLHNATKEHIRESQRQVERELDYHAEVNRERYDIEKERINEFFERLLHKMEIMFNSHDKLHAAHDKSDEEFKHGVREQINQIMRLLDIVREDRALYVSRDTLDARVDAVEKSIVGLEKSLIERFDASVEQAASKYDTKTLANSERITKIEQNIQVMNAKNQQSIIALGILLTVVEIMIRYFQ